MHSYSPASRLWSLEERQRPAWVSGLKDSAGAARIVCVDEGGF